MLTAPYFGPMKSAEQTEASPYASALARVRTLRADPHSAPVQHPDFVQRLKQRIQQARIRLHLPARAGDIAPYATMPYPKDRSGWILWTFVPLLLLVAFALLVTNPSMAPPASVPFEPIAGVYFFNYPVSPDQKTLSVEHATAITAQAVSRVGHDLREWEGIEFDSVHATVAINKNRFNRVDDRSGYYVFEQPFEAVLGPDNRPVSVKFRRLTVTLKQYGDTLKVIVSDSIRSRTRSP